MADRVSIVAVSIAAFLTTINQISIIITAKQLWMQQQQLQQQLERLIRTDTAEGKGTEESPVRSVRRYWTLEGELISEQILMGEIAGKKNSKE